MFQLFVCATINLLEKFSKGAGNVSGVAILETKTLTRVSTK